MRPFDSSRVIQIRYSSALSILIYFDFLELFSLILTLPASLAYLLTCGSAAVERGSRGREKRWRVCGVSGCGQGKRRSFQRAGTEELGTLLFFPGARERHRQLHRIGERVVEPKGAGRGGRGSTPSRLSPHSLLFFSRRGSLTSSSLSLMSFLRSSIPSICLPSTGPSFLSSSDSVGCGSSIPQSQSGYSESGRIVGSAPP